MAERRMFSKSVIDSDAFLDMPLSTQALYFHYNMKADDDGFINSPSKIIRLINASKNDYDLLLFKGFIIPFESGICVIRHWKIHNYIQKDRYKSTMYETEKASLKLEKSGEYTVKNSAKKASNECIQNVSKVDTDTQCIQDVDAMETSCTLRLGKDRLGKESIGESESNNARARTPEILDTLESLSQSVRAVVKSWGLYKGVGEGAELKALVNLVASKVVEFGDKAVVDLINDMMSSGYKQIFWDRLERNTSAGNIANAQGNTKTNNNASEYDFSAFEIGGSE